MSKWLFKGLQTGIKTTRYPAQNEHAPGVTPGLPLGGSYNEEQTRTLARCPAGAFSRRDHELILDYRRCIHCFRCYRGVAGPVNWQSGFEWASATGPINGHMQMDQAFEHSIHILVVDAGDCGACLNEVKQLDNPFYNMHRLGFFITPTPRQADVMLVVGPVTDHMRTPLQKAFDAMPTPRRVIAAGACALSGGVFGPSFVCGAGLRDLIPVDVEVPGCPPPPLAILHALLVAVGRKPSSGLIPSIPHLREKEANTL
jgi:Ni,Fe-hydrogenase III small subunit/ferredoxin-like protein FixX